MKHYSLVLSLALFLLNACQNQDTTEKTTQAPDKATATDPNAKTAAPLDWTKIEKAGVEAQKLAIDMENAIASLDVLPASAKKSQAEEIAAIRNDLSGILEKHRDQLANFNKVLHDHRLAAGNGQLSASGLKQDADNQVADPATVVRDCTEQFEQYAQLFPQYQARIEKLKAGK